MIIKTAPKKAAAMPYLTRLVLRFIYEEHLMSIHEIALMQKSINIWSKYFVDLKEVKAKKHIILLNDEVDEISMEEDALQRLGKLLYSKECKDPQLMNRIAMVKDGRLNWKKFHRLSEAYNKKDSRRARKMYEEYKRKNPEQEKTVNDKKKKEEPNA